MRWLRRLGYVAEWLPDSKFVGLGMMLGKDGIALFLLVVGVAITWERSIDGQRGRAQES